MPLRAADFESAAYAIPPLRAERQCRRAATRPGRRCTADRPTLGTAPASAASPPEPMLDSPSLRIAVRRDPPTVEDLRSTTVSDDPVQRRDLILLERARDGDLDAFNDLVVLYQDQLFALVVRMVPDRDQASDCVQEAFFSAYRNLTSFRGGSVKSWLNRICVNAAMDTQRARKRRPVQPYPELDDESWQPPAGAEADPERTAMLVRADAGARRRAGGDHRRPAIGDRPLRRRGLRLRRDRRDDRRLARDRQVADPPRPARPARPARGPDGAVPWLTAATHTPSTIRTLDRGAARSRPRAASERAIAEARVASCPACAALHADLRRAVARRRERCRPRRDRATSRSRPPTQPAWPTDAGGEPGSATPRLTGVDDRSIHLVRPRLARHDPRRLARRPLAAGRRAHRRRGARRRLRRSAPISTPTCSRSRAATRAMPTPRAAERLHADPRATPLGSVRAAGAASWRSSGRRATRSAGRWRSG